MSAGTRREQLPVIRRARGYHLYDGSGSRYLDLWQGGGRALLGHRPPRAVTRVKNVLSQGVHMGLPSVYERRLLQLIGQRLPGFTAVLTWGDAEARCILGRHGVEAVYDPAFDQGMGDYRAGYWRPVIGPEPPPPEWMAVVMVLPYTLGQAPTPVCIRPSTPVDLTDRQPAALLAAALYGLERLSEYREPVWAVAGWPDGEWTRRGPYIAVTCDEDRYDMIFARFLAAGVLLSPAFPGPSILPAHASDGDVAMLRKLFADGA